MRWHNHTVKVGLIAAVLLTCPSAIFATELGAEDAPAAVSQPSGMEATTAGGAGESVVGRDAAGCDENQILIDSAAPERKNPCPAQLQPAMPVDEARSYLIATAQPGYTMMLQGPAVAIGRLHPEFAQRLAGAIREAREAGLASAGIFSAYRPPAFGIGGFVDKFNSLHTYGLAVDVAGIGAAGSAQALLWHEIAARHGVACPYGPQHPLEWNHCQATQIKIIVPANPLRETVTADGPIDLNRMFLVGTEMIADTGQPLPPTPQPPAQRLVSPANAPNEMATVPAKKTVASARVLPAGRFPFKGVPFKGPPLAGQNVGAWVTRDAGPGGREDPVPRKGRRHS